MQQVLFAAPLVPGPAAWHDVVTPDEEKALIAAIDAAGLTPFQFQGWEGKRLTASFGWHYDFASAVLARGEPMPDWLLPLRTRVARLAGLEPDTLEQALVIRYDSGAGINWHRDRPVFEHVVGVSLGAPAVLRLRRRTAARFERGSVSLPPRGAYHLSGEMRWEWEHSIVPMAQRRWSVTFRSLSERGRRIAC